MTPMLALLRSAQAHNNGFAPRAGFRPFDLADAETTLDVRFREVALRRGGATALVIGETRMSYGELLQRAEAIATNLQSQWGHTGILGICFPSALQTIETMLGTLLGGFGYFCIDPSLSKQQIVKLLDAAGSPAVIGEPGIGGPAPMNTLCPTGIAALYATSGSTGEPKMVALSHRAILFDIGRQSNDLYLGPDDRFDSLFSFAFSASLATVFGALLNGAELHCNDPRLLGGGLLGWLEESGISISTMTVSTFRHACLTKRSQPACPCMRLLSVGGEPLLAADVEAFRSVFAPSCVLQNAMASTETRTYAQYFVPRFEPIRSPVSIGWPVAGKEVTLLDENGVLVPNGADGEIAVRSRYLADGYSNDPERTAAKFQIQPDGAVLYRTGDLGRFEADGSLTFLGRKDSQVKIRGHRVELLAVSQAINLHPAIRTSVVVTHDDSNGNARLAAYIVTRQDESIAEAALRAFLREHLPAYAIPATFAFVQDLPLNANGKVDLRSLPALPEHGAGSRGPSEGKTVEILRDIWEEVLQRPRLSPQDNFFDIGGDSLSAVRVLVAIYDRLRCDLPPDSLQRFPTLKDLAECVDRASGDDARPDSLVVFHEGGAGSPFFFVPSIDGSASCYAHLADRIAHSHPSYGFSTRLGPAANSDVSVESIAAECVAEVNKVVPGGQVVLVGYSFGGTVAFEIARQLRRNAAYDPLPVVIDMPITNAPGVLPPSSWRQALDVACNIPAWVAFEAAHLHPRKFLMRAQGRLAKIGRSFRRRPAAREFDPRIYFGAASVPDAYQAFLARRYEALLNYQPGPYDGKVIVLRAKVPTLFRSRDSRMGWQAVAAGGVDVLFVPGRHDDCVSAVHGAGLAHALMQCVERNPDNSVIADSRPRDIAPLPATPPKCSGDALP
jgi:acyl-coenzyme A synthetase/AMP-(fatty) acid ligase/thioesterase domain-containing protein/acyl carrier protein